MRLLALPLLVLATAPVNAQYFSKGWSPPSYNLYESAETTTTAVAATGTRTAGVPPAPTPTRITPFGLIKKASNMFELSNILTSKPVVSLFSLAGVNITAKVENATASNNFWDERVTLITDENYDDIIVNEPLTEEEEKNRTWIIIISAFGIRQDGMARYADEVFDEVYNETVIANDRPNIRFGRIDYLTVTKLTTKWNIWNAPWLVVIQDRGQKLRFFKTQHVKITPEILHQFVYEEIWNQTPPWESSFGPGGSNEWIFEYLARFFALLYNQTAGLPKWMLYMISGMIGSVALGFLHSKPAQQPVQRPADAAPGGPGESDAATATTSGTETKSPSKRGAKPKKGGRK